MVIAAVGDEGILRTDALGGTDNIPMSYFDKPCTIKRVFKNHYEITTGDKFSWYIAFEMFEQTSGPW